MSSEDTSFKRIVFAKQLKGDITPNTNFAHECRPETCNPESEEMLINQQMLDPPVVLRDFYVCRYMRSHHCTAEKCDKQDIATGACRISGACYAPPGGYSSYDKNNPQTWHSNFRANEKKAQEMFSVQYYDTTLRNNIKRTKARKRKKRAQIRDVITRLLFSPTRKEVNEIRRKQNEKLVQRKIQLYIKKCEEENELVNLIHVAMLRTWRSSKTRELKILDYDENIVDKYTEAIIKVQTLVRKYHIDTFKTDTLALGTLYAMQQGLMLDQRWLIPNDAYLCFNLPIINDLPHFKFQKKRVTTGQKMIKIAFKKAMQSKDPLCDIALV